MQLHVGINNYQRQTQNNAFLFPRTPLNIARGCKAYAKLMKQNDAEPKQLQQKSKDGTTWKFHSSRLLEEKQAFIHTLCRVVIHLRRSGAASVPQSPNMPLTPQPTTTVAEALQFKHTQRFDLIAIPKGILDEHSTRTGMDVCDERLVDGSKTQGEHASLPLTPCFGSNGELDASKVNAKSISLLFMCLQGSDN